MQPVASIGLIDQSSECEDECGTFTTKLLSGNIAKGSWSATITPGSGLKTGTYRVQIFIAKLKGVKGALYYDSAKISLTNNGEAKKPTAENSGKPARELPTKLMTIKCAKGKVTKLVSGKSPKCPAGYTKK